MDFLIKLLGGYTKQEYDFAVKAWQDRVQEHYQWYRRWHDIAVKYRTIAQRLAKKYKDTRQAKNIIAVDQLWKITVQ